MVYVSGLSDAQLDGLISNIKGIYHELLFVAAENADGDAYSAALFEETNYPGADVLITNELTGEVQSVGGLNFEVQQTDLRFRFDRLPGVS